MLLLEGHSLCPNFKHQLSVSMLLGKVYLKGHTEIPKAKLYVHSCIRFLGIEDPKMCPHWHSAETAPGTLYFQLVHKIWVLKCLNSHHLDLRAVWWSLRYLRSISIVMTNSFIYPSMWFKQQTSFSVHHDIFKNVEKFCADATGFPLCYS